MAYIPLTAQQLADKNDKQMKLLQSQGYVWDSKLSAAHCGVVLAKDKDIYVFDMDGEVHHNPQIFLSINL